MNELWWVALGICGASVFGSILGFFVKALPHKWHDTLMGFCAGVMLAAATIGLMLPAFEESEGIFTLWTVLGVVLGAAFLNIIDWFTPHMHSITGLDVEEHRNNHSLNRVLLFVMAIAIHKLPEGMAAGVSVSSDTLSPWAVTMGISLHNIPEGMVIIAPLLLAGVSSGRTFFISLSIGLLEVVGIFLGYALGSVSEVLLPVFLAFAGGAMLYVVSDEMIPETHTHGYQKQATYALLLGFVSFLIMERFL